MWVEVLLWEDYTELYAKLMGLAPSEKEEAESIVQEMVSILLKKAWWEVSEEICINAARNLESISVNKFKINSTEVNELVGNVRKIIEQLLPV